MSSLSAQLARARQAVGVKSPVVRRGKPSLLFSPQEAAELDAHAIYQLGLRGNFQRCMAAMAAGCLVQMQQTASEVSRMQYLAI